MNIPGLHIVKLEGVAWGLALEADRHQLILDVRDEQRKEMKLVAIGLHDFEQRAYAGLPSWWSQLLKVVNDQVFAIEYLDKHDPTQHQFIRFRLDDSEYETVDKIDGGEELTDTPHIYEVGTEYHRTVSSFLGLELPLSCEYLECADKIIISYYLRSEKGFDRFLLVLEDGKKVFKLKQDEKMKGFSSGAFFVLENQLIFIKERNEVCFYTR